MLRDDRKRWTRPARAAFRLALAAALVAAAPLARASTVEDLTLARALELSAEVVIGEVLDVEPRLGERDVIHTETTLLVEESLRGGARPGETLLVRHLGGVVGGLAMAVEGMPGFTAGERVLLFLDRRADRTYRTLGLFQGTYRIVPTAAGEVAVQAPAAGTLVVRPQPAGRLPERIALDELRAAIRAEGGGK